jgi:hypothetical protein
LPWILKCSWFRANGSNFEPFDQIPNFLFRNGLNLFEMKNSLKSKSLDLKFISEHVKP